jgi:hypothetical protein
MIMDLMLLASSVFMTTCCDRCRETPAVLVRSTEDPLVLAIKKVHLAEAFVPLDSLIPDASLLWFHH